MKVLFLTTFYKPINPNDPEYQKESTYKLWRYCKEQGVDAYLARYADLRFEFGTHTSISLEGEEIDQFDLIFPRSATQLHQYGLDHTSMCQIVALYAKERQIRMVNMQNLTEFPPTFSKLFQMGLYGLHQIPIPNSYFSALASTVETFPFPLVQKPFQGSHGNNIGVIDHAKNVSEKEISQVLFQEVLPNRQDYRVLVLNKKPLGAMLRKAAVDKFVANFSAGGTVEPAELDDEMSELATRLATLLKLDFCGVDLMRDQTGRLRVLEVNRFPEFTGFELATNIHVRERVLDYIRNHHE